MKIIYNNFIPFPGFTAINLFGVIFARKWQDRELSEIAIQHEMIHTAQMKELWYVGFYLIYFLEWIYRLIFHIKSAYRGISFEVEAYANQGYRNYTDYRKRFAMWR